MKVKAELSTDYVREDGKVAIRVVVHLNGRKLRVKERAWYILPSDWSKDTRQVRLKRSDGSKVYGDDNLTAADINASINSTINDVESFYQSCPDTSLELLVLAPVRATAARIARMEEQTSEPVPMLTFWDWTDEFIKRALSGKILVRKGKNKGSPLSPNTVKGYVGSVANLRAFHERRMPIDWKTIGKDLHEELLHFLRTELQAFELRKTANGKARANERPRRDNSVGKDVKNFKALIGWAMLDLESDRYRGKFPEITAHKKEWFIVPEEEVDKIALEPEESQTIMALDLSERPGLVAHRDRFTVAYYFLQRFGDSMAFDKSNFFRAKDKGNVMRRYFRYRSQKTGTEAIIPVSERVWNILETYNFELPAMSNQKANEALKEIGRLASEKCESLNGWFYDEATVGGKKVRTRHRRWELITTHTCRRSGTTDMEESGVPIGIILALGGWTTEDQLRTYIKRRARKQAERAAQHEFFQ